LAPKLLFDRELEEPVLGLPAGPQTQGAQVSAQSTTRVKDAPRQLDNLIAKGIFAASFRVLAAYSGFTSRSVIGGVLSRSAA
jgi:hypothetical protein